MSSFSPSSLSPFSLCSVFKFTWGCWRKNASDIFPTIGQHNCSGPTAPSSPFIGPGTSSPSTRATGTGWRASSIPSSAGTPAGPERVRSTTRACKASAETRITITRVSTLSAGPSYPLFVSWPKTVGRNCTRFWSNPFYIALSQYFICILFVMCILWTELTNWNLLEQRAKYFK